MSARPTIAPGVLASIISAAPERLQKKLDREPRVADDWAWEHADGVWTVVAGEEQVTVPAGTITEIVQIKCTCLLSPRCFHVLAVLNIAEIVVSEESPAVGSESAGATSTAESNTTTASSVSEGNVELSEPQTRAAHLMSDACAGILANGLRAAGAVVQSRLLRAIHECRAEGLHRIAAGGLRLMANLRLLRDDSDLFNSSEAAQDLSEVLEGCRRLTYLPSVGMEWIGIARRSYEPVNSLKLHGLFCEPVLTRSGYAGVVTWLMADDGWLGTASDVQPGDAGRIDQAWRSGVSLAGLSLSHRELSRKCLLISKATRSVDGRLGGGESARAVTVDSEGWNAPAIAARFMTPLAEQIQRVFARQQQSEFLQSAGTDLVFFHAVVLCYAGQELIVKPADSNAILRLGISQDDDRLAFRGSLQMLARAPGLAIRCIGRVDPRTAGRIDLLAVAPASPIDSDSPTIVTTDINYVFSIGLDEIHRSHLSKAEIHPVKLSIGDTDATPLISGHDTSLERWLYAILAGGRHAIPQGLVTTAVRDAHRLKANLRPTAASLLLSLTQSANTTATDLSGIRLAEPPSILAEKWLAASIGSRAAKMHLQLHHWLQLFAT